MKTGIIGLPQVGKTSLFRILTKAHLSSAPSNPREAHVGVAKVPDDRLDRLAVQYNPKKLTHASVEYVDLGAIGQEALKESGYLGHLRQVDAIAHVVRAFEDDSIPHAGPIDPLRDIKNVEFDLMVGGVFVIEALSVIFQVGFFKMTKRTTGTGRRLFRMTPLHHHFEMQDWKESQIVFRFLILAILFALLSLSTLKLR